MTPTPSRWPDGSRTKRACSIGGSGGTAVVAALRVAATAPQGSCVVVLVPDTGRNYISKIFNDDWMRGYGFMHHADRTDRRRHPRRQGRERDRPDPRPDRPERARGHRSHALARRLPGGHRRHRRAAAGGQGGRRFGDELDLMELALQGPHDARSPDRSGDGTDPRDHRRR